MPIGAAKQPRLRLPAGIGSFSLAWNRVGSRGQGIPVTVARKLRGAGVVSADGGPSISVPVVVSPPTAPDDLVFLGWDSLEFYLQWDDNSSNETLFRLQYQEPDESIVWQDWISGNLSDNPTVVDVESFTVLVGGEPVTGTQTSMCKLQFRVRAENAGGASAWSNTLIIPPTIIIENLNQVSPPTSTEVELAWTPTDETGNNTQQGVYRSIDGGAWVELSGDQDTSTATFEDASVLYQGAKGAAQQIRYKIVNHNDGGVGPDSNIYQIN